jgi:putative tryptophan/tyrosine transport system substrate-binding protein
MNRRSFISLLGGAAAAWPLAARAQQGARMRRIGVLAAYAENDPEAQARINAFQRALQELGWTEGHNVRMDYRWGTGDPDRARTFTKELLSLAPDVIGAHGTPALTALHQSNAHDPGRIRIGYRPGRCRLRPISPATGRQHYRLQHIRT